MLTFCITAIVVEYVGPRGLEKSHLGGGGGGGLSPSTNFA
jgi:hypothetical protein